ncbi:MAG: MATE family efflux transporter [Treponema sp.]|nr:MATE family efflux transporter [Treponema sp.]
MQKNLTQGSVLKNIIYFSAPFLLSYFLQTLYGMADLFIAGQFYGAEVISAVSIGSQVMHMLTVMIVGLAMGSSVLIAQSVGAENKLQTKKLIGTSISLFFILALVFTLILFFLARPIALAVRTPEESLEETVNYLRICFAGIPLIFAYNVIASIYRGQGDSKSPMYLVIIACLINILLDYVFMGRLNMNARGAAFATVIAQAFSVIAGLIIMFTGKNKYSFTFRDFFITREISRDILKIGIPIACQDGFIQISFIVITAIANKRGLEVSAAVGIVEKIITFLFLIPSSMLSTISAMGAQNIGAGKRDRAKLTLLEGSLIAAGFGIIWAVLFQFISLPLLSLFTSEESVQLLGCQYLRAYITDCFFASIHFCFSGYFCALGKSLYSFIHNAISVIFIRIPGAYLASLLWPETLTPMGFAAPLGSFISILICAGFFIYIERHNKNI